MFFHWVDPAARYTGSRLLEPLLPEGCIFRIDQVNYLVGISMTFIASLYMRYSLDPTETSPRTRHAFAGTVGLCLAIFMYGYDTMHLFLQMVICYLLIRLSNRRYQHILVFVFSMTYLSVINIRRIIYDYGGVVVNITGSMMILTQRMIMLSFSVYDGNSRKKSNLNDTEKVQRVKKPPNPLEMFSYTFFFPAICSGPLFFYKDYEHFIMNGPPESKSAIQPVLMKLANAGFAIFVNVWGNKKFPPSTVVKSSFIAETNIVQRMMGCIVGLHLTKAKFYFAWSIADAACNVAGFGYRIDRSEMDEMNETDETDSKSKVTPISFRVLNLSERKCCTLYSLSTKSAVASTRYNVSRRELSELDEASLAEKNLNFSQEASLGEKESELDETEDEAALADEDVSNELDEAALSDDDQVTQYTKSTSKVNSSIPAVEINGTEVETSEMPSVDLQENYDEVRKKIITLIENGIKDFEDDKIKEKLEALLEGIEQEFDDEVCKKLESLLRKGQEDEFVAQVCRELDDIVNHGKEVNYDQVRDILLTMVEKNIEKLLANEAVEEDDEEEEEDKPNQVKESELSEDLLIERTSKDSNQPSKTPSKKIKGSRTKKYIKSVIGSLDNLDELQEVRKIIIALIKNMIDKDFEEDDLDEKLETLMIRVEEEFDENVCKQLALLLEKGMEEEFWNEAYENIVHIINQAEEIDYDEVYKVLVAKVEKNMIKIADQVVAIKEIIDEEEEEIQEAWDLVSNVNASRLELATNIRSVSTNWNIQTHNWIKYVCYDRVKPNIRLLLSYVLIALWHGFYPGYYVSFVQVVVSTETARLGRRLVRPYFLRPDEDNHTPEPEQTYKKCFYDLLTLLLTWIWVNYNMTPFYLLEWQKSIMFYTSVHWWMHILVSVGFVLFTLIDLFEGQRRSTDMQLRKGLSTRLEY